MILDDNMPPTDIWESLLREYVGSIPSSNVAGGLIEAYEYFGLVGEENSYSTSRLHDLVLDKVIELLREEQGVVGFRFLKSLEEQLILRHLVDDLALDPYLQVVELIKGALRPGIRLTDMRAPQWAKAIQLVCDYVSLATLTKNRDLTQLELVKGRQFSIAKQIRILRKSGYQVSVVYGKPCISDQEARKIVRNIETDIAEVGPLWVASSLLNHYSALYNENQGRLNIVRQFPSHGSKKEPSIPIGYLLQLCVKQMSVPGERIKGDQVKLNNIITVSTAFCSTYDVEPYNQFEIILQDEDSILQLMTDIAVYDSSFTLTQWRPKDIPSILTGIFNWVPGLGLDIGAPISSYVDIAGAILTMGDKVRPLVFTVNDIEHVLPHLQPDIVSSVLDAFSHQEGSINRDFILPHEQSQVTFGFKPLIQLADNRYVLMNPSWCAPAFYEALCARVAQSYGRFPNDQLGTAFEQFVRSVLRERNVPVFTGKYRALGQDGECDAVAEFRDVWVFIESKMKVLTRASKGADIIGLLVDLAKSLLAAHLQSGQHEILLRKAGQLDLIENQSSYQIALAEKDVERIALTFIDYGGFQDRRFLQLLLGALAGRKLSASNAADQARLDSLLPDFEKLYCQHQDLASLKSLGQTTPYFNCWFLSLGQLLILLDNVVDGDTFQKEIYQARHLSLGTLDFYFEYSIARSIKH